MTDCIAIMTSTNYTETQLKTLLNIVRLEHLEVVRFTHQERKLQSKRVQREEEINT